MLWRNQLSPCQMECTGGGDSLNRSKLFIHNCYKDLWNSTLGASSVTQHGTIIMGTPGIRKSFFGYYLLYLVETNNIPIVYHHTANPVIYLFDENSIQVLPHARILDLINMVE